MSGINYDLKLSKPRKLKFEKKYNRHYQHDKPEESKGWSNNITGNEMMNMIKRNFKYYTEAKKRAQSS